MTDRLRVTGTFPKGIAYYPELVARELGFFEDEKLEVVWVDPSPGLAAYRNLTAGLAEIALGGIWRPLTYVGRLRRLHGFAQLCARCPYVLVSRERVDHFVWANLVGKSVIVTGLAPSGWIFLQGLLRRARINPADVHYYHTLPLEEGAALFRGGLADFFVTVSPTADLLIKEGRGYEALRFASMGEVPWSVYFALPEFLDRNVELVGRFVRVLERALQWTLAHDTREAMVVARKWFPQLPEDTFVDSVNADKTDQIWVQDARIPELSLANWQDMLVDERYQVSRVPYAEIVDARAAQWASTHK